MPTSKSEGMKVFAGKTAEATGRYFRLKGSQITLVGDLQGVDRRRDTSAESLPFPADRDFLAWLSWVKAARSFYIEHLRDSYSSEVGIAIRDEDEEQPGKYKIIFRTKDGVETCHRGLPAVGQPLSLIANPAVVAPIRGEGTDLKVPTADDSWNVLIDAHALVTSRAEAMAELYGTGLEPQALAYLSSELERADLQSDWRDVLVFAAEDTHFPVELRDKVCVSLLRIASELRCQPDGPEKVVWSTLRRAASLLPPSGVNQLLPFLDPGGSIDTRSVSLQCISRVFEAQPPTVVPSAVADRAHRFAERFLDPDVFTPGEPSLIARNAVAALAATGDSRLSNTLSAVRSLGRSWLDRRVSEELSRIHRGWVDRGFSEGHPAVANLGNALTLFAVGKKAAQSNLL